MRAFKVSKKLPQSPCRIPGVQSIAGNIGRGLNKLTPRILDMCSQSLVYNLGWLPMQGFEDVRNISGGIDAYSRVADSSVPLY